jgi:glycosyltransferase involved in cell wall biosynthesis
MRILFISFFFPPYNSIGALRTGKTAKYLSKLGHDVRVVSAADQNTVNASLPLELDPDRVNYAKWVNLRWPLDKFVGKGKTADFGGAMSRQGMLASRAAVLYRSLVYLPDLQAGWYPYARRAADRLIADWRPDVILSSSSPVTSLLLAHRLSNHHGIPWIGDLRDLWVDNQDYQAPGWRKRLDVMMERRVMRSATAFVTVSEPLAETLRRKFGKPTQVVLNGFDACDYARDTNGAPRDGALRLVFTGTIYAGRQTPEPLFHALHLLGDKAKGVRVDFYGSPRGPVTAAPHYSGLEEIVTLHPSVPHDEIVSIQKSADVLLHLLWNDPAQPGVYNAKVFEYFGARRPILAVGYTGNVTAELVRERTAGAALDDPQEIAQTLDRWLDQRASGSIAALPQEASRGLSREEQTHVLHDFMLRVLGTS